MNTARRAIQYPGIGSRFCLSQEVWEETVAALRFYGDFRSEGLVFWGGAVGASGETVVTALLKLNHKPQGGCVHPSAEEMRKLLRTLRARDEKLVAQIHSHPGEAFHSFGDSQHATSYHAGFISIVLPNYGSGVKSIHDCAVYEFRGDFEALSHEEIEKRFLVLPQIVNLMPPTTVTETEETTKRGSIWSVLKTRVKSIVSRRR